jgi:uncharacterized membrane protein
MFLTTTEADEIEAHVAGIEARTGVQIVAAVVGKSDTYVELPWKAFALGVSAAALASVTVDALRPEWTTANTAIIQAVIVLGAGGAVALLAIFVPAFARLFLRAARAEAEVRQYAQSMCLQRQIFATPGRTGVLVIGQPLRTADRDPRRYGLPRSRECSRLERDYRANDAVASPRSPLSGPSAGAHGSSTSC